MKPEIAIELLKMATQLTAGKTSVAASGKSNVDKVLGESVEALKKHFEALTTK